MVTPSAELGQDRVPVVRLSSCLHQLPVSPVVIGGNSVHPASVVRDLGVWIDRGLSLSTHVTKVVAGCFAVLRRLNSIRRSVSRESLTGLVVSRS